MQAGLSTIRLAVIGNVWIFSYTRFTKYIGADVSRRRKNVFVSFGMCVVCEGKIYIENYENRQNSNTVDVKKKKDFIVQ